MKTILRVASSEQYYNMSSSWLSSRRKSLSWSESGVYAWYELHGCEYADLLLIWSRCFSSNRVLSVTNNENSVSINK